jgi:PAS domain S-box-containing protein
MTHTRDVVPERALGPVSSLFPIVERLTEGVIIVDPQNRICWANTAMEPLFGLVAHEATGCDRDEVVSSRVLAVFQGRTKQAMKLFFPENPAQAAKIIRFSILTPKGRKRQIEYTSFSAKKGVFSGYRLEFFRDISGIDPLINETPLFIADIRRLIEHFPTAYYLLDSDGTIIDGSGATEEITGYHPDSLKGKRLQTSPLLSRNQLVRAARFIENHLRGRREDDGTFVITRKDGRLVHVTLEPSTLRHPTRFLIIGIRHERSADADAAKKELEYIKNLEFLSRISHEILDLSPGDDYYTFISSRLSELCPGSLIFVNSINMETCGIRIESVRGLSDRLLSSITDLLGTPPEDWAFTIPAGVDEEMFTGSLVPIDGVKALTFGEWPENICRDFESLIDIGRIYGIGFTWKGRLYGNAVIIRRDDTEISNRATIEAFIGQISVALQRRQAEEELRRSRELHSNIIESMNDAVAVVDRNYTFTFWNRAMEEFTKISREEAVTGRLFAWQVFPRITAQKLDEICHPVWQGGVFRREEVPYLLSSGREGSLSDVFLPLRSSEGEIEGIITIMRDITEKRIVDEALRASEEKYRELVENANSIILKLDTDGRIIFFNEFAEQFFGYREEEVIGKSAFETIIPETEISGRDLREYFAKIFEDTSLYPASENENIRKDGTRAWIAWRNRAIHDSDGNCTGILSVGNDITEKKHANALIRENEVKYRTLFESAHDGISLMKQGRFIDCNAQYNRLFGCPVEEIIGSTPEYFSPLRQPDGTHSGERMVEYMERARAGTPQFFEWQHRRRDGTLVDTEISLTNMGTPGEELLLTVVRDVTDSRRAREALRESERKYRQIAEYSFDGIVTVDHHGMVQYASPSTKRILGYRPDEMIGREFVGFLELSERARFTARNDKTLHGEAIEGFQVRMQRKDGRCIFVDMNGNPIVREGRIDGFQILIRDISDRKRAEEAEQEKEFIDYLLTASLNNTPLGMLLFQADGDDLKIIDWNYAAESIFGWTRAEVLGRNFLEFLPAYGTEQDVSRRIVEIVDDRTPHNFESECNTGDGRRVRVKWFNTPIYDRKTESLYVMSLAEDITERAKVEDEVRESEVRYRTTIDSMGDPVHVIDYDFKILLVNRAFTLWFEDLDLNPGVVDSHITAAFPMMHGEILDEYKWVFETGEMLLGKEKMRFGETEFVMETRKIPVFEHGEVVRVVTVIRDVTSSAKLERLKEEAFAQIEKNMEQFAILNDHIRNPLQAMVGLADLEGGVLAEKIYQQAMEIDAIIKQLDIGWIESKKIREFLRKHYGVS